MNSSPEPSVYIPVESYCATNLLCPDLPFAENGVLKNRKLVKEIFYCALKKTGNWLKKFSIVRFKSKYILTAFSTECLKNRKPIERLFYCALKNRKLVKEIFYCALKNRKNFALLL